MFTECFQMVLEIRNQIRNLQFSNAMRILNIRSLKDTSNDSSVLQMNVPISKTWCWDLQIFNICIKMCSCFRFFYNRQARAIRQHTRANRCIVDAEDQVFVSIDHIEHTTQTLSRQWFHAANIECSASIETFQIFHNRLPRDYMPYIVALHAIHCSIACHTDCDCLTKIHRLLKSLKWSAARPTPYFPPSSTPPLPMACDFGGTSLPRATRDHDSQHPCL